MGFFLFLITQKMSNFSYYTTEGLKKLKDELDYLKSIERPKASHAIAEARDKGDLSENAEYDAAKEHQHQRISPRAHLQQFEHKRGHQQHHAGIQPDQTATGKKHPQRRCQH